MDMKNFKILCFLIITIFTHTCYGQGKAISFEEAQRQGIKYQQLDSLYISAIHTDSSKALFKTIGEIEHFEKGYIQFIHDLGSFLHDNNFKWEKPTRCFNRIYIDTDGTVDYILYSFTKDQITSEKEKEFDKLINKFIQSHKFPIKANVKFSQSSPVRYIDREKK
jgi:hypothetical protein